MGQTKNAAQLVVGRAKAVSNDDQCRRRFTSMVEDIAGRILNPVSDSKPDNAEQIGSAINHPCIICAQHTFFNLTICALRT